MTLGEILTPHFISRESQKVCITDNHNTTHFGYLDAMFDNGVLDELMCADITDIIAYGDTLTICIYPE